MAEALANLGDLEDAEPYLDVAKESGTIAQDSIAKIEAMINNTEAPVAENAKETIVMSNDAKIERNAAENVKQDPQDLFTSEPSPVESPNLENTVNPTVNFEKLEQEIAELKSQLENKNSELETTKNQLTETEGVVNELENDLKDIRLQNSTMKQEFVNFKNQIVEKDAFIADLQAQKTEQVDNNLDEITQITQETAQIADNINVKLEEQAQKYSELESEIMRNRKKAEREVEKQPENGQFKDKQDVNVQNKAVLFGQEPMVVLAIVAIVSFILGIVIF